MRFYIDSIVRNQYVYVTERTVTFQMTNMDIIRTAFKVWGRELYINTSLSMIAEELGVSKPALYRHFKNKQALLNAMYDFFFDDYSSFILPGYERSIQMENPTERLFLLMRTITEYYALHGDFFVFSLIQVYGNRKKGDMLAALRARNIDIECLDPFTFGKNDYPSSMQMITSTIIFWIAHFHKHERQGAVLEQAIPRMVYEVEQRITYGLACSPDEVNKLNVTKLESYITAEGLQKIESNNLLKAVAAAVAEAGPWDATMDMVARLSGLSKSGLYAHFKNKHDMVQQLFTSELDTIIAFTEQAKKHSREPLEQLYLAISAIVSYLRSHPEILVSIDWIRTRKLKLQGVFNPILFRIFSEIQLPALIKDRERGESEGILPQWILFLIVNLLKNWPKQETLGTPSSEPGPCLGFGQFIQGTDTEATIFNDLPNSSIMILFKFITLGIRGFN
ncbi:hypothetical protein FACS1894200_04110 [Spirochaetia bacterium]|nr:hypothetical protein FACS1894200_04110 [Spirochaetia bacterium]